MKFLDHKVALIWYNINYKMLACLSKLGMMLEQWGWSGDNGKYVGKYVNVISFTRTQKAWPSLCKFSQNSEMLNDINFRSLVPNFTQKI